MSKLRVPCVPRVWLLLSGQYRTFPDTRHSIKKMLERSVGQCYFVALLTPTLSSDKGSAVTKTVQRDWLEADARLFDTRLAYLTVERHQKPNTGFWYNYANHWRGVWTIADTLQKMHGFATDGSTIVVRSRPDVCFRDCFDFTNAAKVFASHRYLIIGQQISADNNMFTNVPTYAEQIAPYITKTSATANALEHPDEHTAMLNAWQRGSVHYYSQYCELQDSTSVEPCAVKTFQGSWQNHCICRGRDSGNWVACIDDEDKGHLGVSVRNTMARACVDITKGVTCLYPKDWRRLPEGIRPTAQEIAGGLEPWNISYFPNGGINVCRVPSDLVETS
mmetsp:Transcript_13562/g.28886  ORF Transcript_13562/g.28886 Transcript_13562/m.28886 type:complete len:334 (-) Transcript_13562:9-1010(-)